ncbi:5-methylthioadenosine/S-adenosylhomocysteine deaminase [Kribbella voronezhensis]|uniref:5-methylthioadenosine/S-adenosylhomocysteine deaminase n=1 Tax=Kribbella voronezhensis TaxID=2512212 RepID=A0A4R7SXW4_9ACTN|nr:5-methylthioadenosine/S-adenosylhomocysteine deaminase [Kribbella voronezhensis]
MIRNCSVLVVPETGECRVDEAQDIYVQDGAIAAITDTGTPVAGRPPFARSADARSVSASQTDDHQSDAAPGAAGSVDARSGGAGSADAGPGGAGSVGAGSADARWVDASSGGAGSADAGPGGAGSVGAGSADARWVDASSGGAGSVDARSGSAGSVEVLDGSGLLAVPGLTNSHTHSPMVMMRGAAEDVSIDDWFNRKIWPMEVNLTPERVRVGARLACAEMLLAGVTTFVDHYFHADQIAEAALESGIRADLAPTFFSSTGTEGREAAFAAVREIRARGEAAANGHPPRVTASLGPHAPYTVTDEDLRRTAEVARAEGLRIHLHAAETEDQTQSSIDRHGVTPIEVLARTGVLEAGALIAHGCGIREADLALLAPFADRTAVACCPKVYLKLAMGSTTPIKSLQSAGIPVGIGTDGAAVHNTLDLWESLRLVALTQKQREQNAEWMTVSDTLRLATRGGATAAGLHYLTGALEPGRRADIALVDLSAPHHQPIHDARASLVYSTRASDVVHVVVDGNIVVRDRTLTTVDLAEILEDARTLAHTLVDLSANSTIQTYAP